MTVRLRHQNGLFLLLHTAKVLECLSIRSVLGIKCHDGMPFIDFTLRKPKSLTLVWQIHLPPYLRMCLHAIVTITVLTLQSLATAILAASKSVVKGFMKFTGSFFAAKKR